MRSHVKSWVAYNADLINRNNVVLWVGYCQVVPEVGEYNGI